MTLSAMERVGSRDLEGEFEQEEFLGNLIRGAAQGVFGALGGSGESEFEWEGEYEDEAEDEYEFEFEAEDEGEALANPLRRVYRDAMLEHLGHASAEAESEAEAEAFIGAAVPLATGLARTAAPAISRALPGLVRAVAGTTRALRRNPATRPLVRALPTIITNTTADLARQYSRGRPITAQRALRTLAGQTASVLENPTRRTRVLRRARAADRVYHRAVRDGRTWTRLVTAGGMPSVMPVTPVRPTTSRVRDVRDVRTGRPVRVLAPGAVPLGGVPSGLSVAWVPVPALQPRR